LGLEAEAFVEKKSWSAMVSSRWSEVLREMGEWREGIPVRTVGEREEITVLGF
jgi:hypothetical protein